MPKAKSQAQPAINERLFTNQVKALARTLGYKTYHTFFSIKSEKGWPDLAIYKPGILIFAELKTSKGRLTQAQIETLHALYEADQIVFVWRPEQYQQIAQILQCRPDEIRAYYQQAVTNEEFYKLFPTLAQQPQTW